MPDAVVLFHLCDRLARIPDEVSDAANGIVARELRLHVVRRYVWLAGREVYDPEDHACDWPFVTLRRSHGRGARRR